MDVELKRILSLLRNKGALTNGVPTAESFSNITDSAEAVSDEIAKVPKSDAAVTWNATALASINAEVDTALNTIVPASPTAGSLNDALSKAAGGNTFDKTTDSLEALSDKVALDSTVAKSAELDKVPKSDAAVTWNATALASINAEVDTALNTAVPVSPTSYSLNDILSAVSGANTFVKATDSLEALGDITQALQQAQGLEPELIKAVFTGNLANTGTATCSALDALGKTMQNVKAKIWISGATAGAGITPHWFLTTDNNLTTFVEQTVPTLGAQHVLAAAAIENYPPTGSLGNVPEGLQAELRIDSAGNDSALTYICYVEYKQGGE